MTHRSTIARLVSAAGLTILTACAAPEARPPEVAPPAARPPLGSTIDARLQVIADEELDRTLAEWKASAGTVLILDPASGEILASAGRVDGASSSVALQRAYVTGSTLKTILVAAALDEGVVTPADSFDCGQGQRAYGDHLLRDASPRGALTLAEMLAVSTNVGFSHVADRLGGDRVGRWFRRFHFGQAPGVLPASIDLSTLAGARTAIGGLMTATPLQVAAAYAAIANEGAYVAPTLGKRTGAPPREQLVRPETARAVKAMLDAVVNGPLGTGAAARVAGARVIGKTGTAIWKESGGGEGRYASFVGIVPADAPRFVILVGVEGPRDDGGGHTVAAPAFARVASRALGG